MNNLDGRITQDISNGTTVLGIKPGQRYVLGAASTSWAGSLTIGWKSNNGTVVAFPNTPLTANGGFEFVAPAKEISLTLSGASVAVQIQISPVR